VPETLPFLRLEISYIAYVEFLGYYEVVSKVPFNRAIRTSRVIGTNRSGQKIAAKQIGTVSRVESKRGRAPVR